MSRALLGWVFAALAAFVLVLAFGEVFSPLTHTTFGINDVWAAPGGNAVIGNVVPRSSAAKAGLRAGDVVVLQPLTLSERYRLLTGYGPLGSTITFPVRRGDTTRVVTLRAGPGTPRIGTDPTTLLLQATIQLVILGALVLIRPSLATAALVFYGTGAVTTFAVVGEFSALPDPWFGVVAVAIVAAFSALPYLALPVFITRFPHSPHSRAGIARMRAADAIFVVATVWFVLEAIFEPVEFSSWGSFADVGLAIVVPLVIILGFGATAYRDADGESRRRIGWVMAGFVIAAISDAAINALLVNRATRGSSSLALLTNVLQLAPCLFPIALAYAVLRHRVLDIGFALNRTMLYATMTTIVVGVVSLLDWGVSRAFAEQRWALAIEGFVTVGFGFTLNWLHGRTERLLDRVVFRKRHVAEKRIEYRIDALGFASSTGAVDEALGIDACRILELRSGAVFTRVAESPLFRRALSTGWEDGTAQNIDSDALLVRTLRSLERPTFLDEVAVEPEAFPLGEARPVLAVPIVAQHELVGFALYGNRADGASPDPEEVMLLARLAAAAGNAYGAVEARQWRARAAELEAFA